jgi:CheY-like chemotaxis protein
MNKLVNDMVDLSRIELDNVHENPESINVRRLFKEVLADLEPRIKRKKLVVDNQLNRESEIEVNRIRIKQIFLNMMYTLVKVNSENGKIRISDENTGKEYIIRFIDTNDELNKTDLERIFDPFNHLIGDRKMLGIESIGLELAIVKATVEKMGGHIFIEQNQNFGNTIGMMLPIEKLTNYEVVNDGEFIELLYIEDSISSVKNMENIANQFSNVRMTSSYTSDYGLSLLRVNHYDIIFVDVNLPVFNGMQIFGIIRAISHLDDAKVVAVAGSSDVDEIRQFMDAGFDDFLHKPIDPDLVKIKLMEMTQNRTTLKKQKENS